ncbi:uncharacterized protein [Physcomitrium patens]|uniref:uncharacterized protein n=1 Tax=Physcomitrium patens TaxID=3218 RepID=UPI003CCCCB5F
MAELAARESRIAVRRARVAARLLAANSAKKDHRKSRAEIEKDAGVGDRQLSMSLHCLSEIRKKLKDEVKSLRDGADLREYEHRMEETSKRGVLCTSIVFNVIINITVITIIGINWCFFY